MSISEAKIKTNPSFQVKNWLVKLRRSGYRLTMPRRAVVETLAESEFALNPMEIFQQAGADCPGLGLVTVYRTLEKLEELNLIQRVHTRGGCQAYIAAADGHEHLLICTSCNHAEFFSGDDLDNLISQIGSSRGFIISEHWLQLFGICPACQQRQPGTAA